MVDRAGRSGSTKLNFVITHYFVDEDKDFVPDSFCYKPDGGRDCLPFTQDVIDQFTKLTAACLQHAVQVGFDLAFTPHLDDGLGSGQWRNAMQINPIQK